MTDMQIVTQPMPVHVRNAADLLEAVLLGDLDLDTRFAVASCLAELVDVHPPYSPSPPVCEPIPVTQGIQRVRAELNAAFEATTGVQEPLRIGMATRELRLLR